MGTFFPPQLSVPLLLWADNFCAIASSMCVSSVTHAWIQLPHCGPQFQKNHLHADICRTPLLDLGQKLDGQISLRRLLRFSSPMNILTTPLAATTTCIMSPSPCSLHGAMQNALSTSTQNISPTTTLCENSPGLKSSKQHMLYHIYQHEPNPTQRRYSEIV